MWIRMDRNITVLIEDAKTVGEKEGKGKGKVVGKAFAGLKIGKAVLGS